jgi:hypothetical protein
VLRLGPDDARALLIVSSGMHGVEGYCGSGCQQALMHDDDLLARLARGSTALLLVHAINPYGFSHLRRTNEENLDVNRNFLDFTHPLPANDDYAQLHPLLLPAQWPPSAENEAAIRTFVARYGEARFRDAVSSGQHSHADGMFYTGRAPAWSNLTLRDILREHGAGQERMGWIDIHTGLGPVGHGDKIFAALDERFKNLHDPMALKRARAVWGADVVSIFDLPATARYAAGGGIACLPRECPWATTTTIGLEFGTRNREAMQTALRGEHWLHNHPEAPPQQREVIKKSLLDCFCVDSPEWRGRVVAQTRVMVLQALAGLAVTEA